MDEILYRKNRPQPVESLPLFAGEAEIVEPTWLTSPTSALEHRFAAFHRANPHVYDAIERKAMALVTLGRTRLGIAELVEELRYDPRLVTKGEHFKLNNDYRAFYARLLIHNHSSLASIIGLREQTHAREDR